MFFIVQTNREQLGKIAALMDSGAIRPIIAQTIPLARAKEAFERGVAGHTQGKLALEVAALSELLLLNSTIKEADLMATKTATYDTLIDIRRSNNFGPFH